MPEEDNSLHNCLTHLDSYEGSLGKELARTRGVLASALSAILCATKRTHQDRAVKATVKILEDELGRLEKGCPS